MKNIQKAASEILKKSGEFNNYNRHFNVEDKFEVEYFLTSIQIRITRTLSAPPMTSSDPTRIGERLKDDIAKLIDIISKEILVSSSVDRYVLLSADKGKIYFHCNVDFSVKNKKDFSKLEAIGKQIES